MREVTDHQPRIPRAQRMQLRDELLTILQRADRIEDEDVVERALQRFQRRGVFGIAFDEGEIGVALPRDPDVLAAEIYSDAMRWREARERVANAASDLEDATSRGIKNRR